MLISLLTLSLTAFSQTGTSNQPTKCFTIPVVKQITKDLLSGDSAKAQLKLTEQQLFETEKKVEKKDSIITLLRMKENNYLTIIDAHEEKYSTLDSHTKKLETNLKKEKIKNKLTSGVGSIAILTLTILLITN